MDQFGYECLSDKCMLNGCPLIVPNSIWEASLTKGKLIDKYHQLFKNSLVNDDEHNKCCPSPGCENVVWIERLNRKEVLCECGFYFHPKCSEEAHTPAKCDDAKKWI